MEDLNSYIEKAESDSSNSKKSFDFFGDVVCVIIDSLSWEIHLWGMQEWEVAYLRLNFFRLLVGFFSWVGVVITTLDTELCKIETSRDPPLIFIPIPKLVESSGCARSDLIRSLIF